MAGYTIQALSLDQPKNASSTTLAVSVIDSNGQPVQNLGESNFTIRNISSGVALKISELHYAGVQGFYRLSLKTEPMVNSGEYIVALVVKGHHHEAGRVPQPISEGQTLVKVRVAV